MNLVTRLAEQAASHPDRPALIEGCGRRRRALTYRELDQRVAAGAGTLQARGIGPGDSVLFLHPVAVEMYVALLATFRVGATAVFIEPSAGGGVVRSALERLAPQAFFASPKAHLWRLLHPAVRRLPCHFTTVAWLPGTRWTCRGGAAEIAACGPERPALVTFTSGSTGEPKAAVRTHGFLEAQYEVLRSAIDLEPGEVDLVTLPVFALANLASGVTSVLAEPDPGKAAPAAAGRLREQIESEGVTRCAASPTFFERLLAGGAGLRAFRKLYTGGAPVFPVLLERLAAAAPGARLEAVYGSTEAEPIAHVEWREISRRDLDDMRAGQGLLAGRPVPAIRLAVLPNTWGTPLPDCSEAEFEARRLPPGTPGEIVVAGEHVLKGYLDGRGDRDTKFRVAGTVWHRTGDTGRLDAAGRLWLLGRAGAVICRAGGDLYPLAVETALSFQPRVRRSALVARGTRTVLAVEWAAVGASTCAGEIGDELRWAGIDQTVTLPRIPVDRRHRAKVDYPALHAALDWEQRGKKLKTER